jgi:DNA-binding transcriptional ArsR family regulator
MMSRTTNEGTAAKTETRVATLNEVANQGIGLEDTFGELGDGLNRSVKRARDMAAQGVAVATGRGRRTNAAIRESTMDKRVKELKPYLAAVADATRLCILQELAQHTELPVHDISEALVLSQPLTSWHLLILKRANLVKTRKAGRQVLYRLDREHLLAYQAQFAELIAI